MQIDGNWKLCQVLKSVSPIRLRVNFGSSINFTLLAPGTVRYERGSSGVRIPQKLPSTLSKVAR